MVGGVREARGGRKLPQFCACWWTVRRVQWVLNSILILRVGTWMLSYMMWLGHGCAAFLPWLSDLAGGPSETLFAVGFLASAASQVPICLDLHFAGKSKLQDSGRFRQCLHLLWVLIGIVCSIGIAGVVLNPWQYRLDNHFQFAKVTFISTGLFSILAMALGRGSSRGISGFLAMTSIAFVSFGLLLYCAWVGDKQMAAHLGRSGIEQNMQLMREDFTAYCTGEGISMHRYLAFNLAAMFEWLFLLLMLAVVYLVCRRDLQGWPNLEPPVLVAEDRLEDSGTH